MDNCMNCQQCLREHNQLIKNNNHGYSYIGTINNCMRHKKWTNNESYEKSYIRNRTTKGL